jgi:uncharacterized membrane protein
MPDFKEEVKLTVPVLPKGWKVHPKEVTLKPDDGEVVLKVTVDQDTLPGEHSLTVRAASGDSTADLRLTLKVER